MRLEFDDDDMGRVRMFWGLKKGVVDVVVVVEIVRILRVGGVVRVWEVIEDEGLVFVGGDKEGGRME